MKKDIPIIDTIGMEEEGIITAKKVFESRNISKLPNHITTAVVLFDHSPSPIVLEKSKELFEFVAAASVVKQYIYDNKIVLAYSPLGGPAAGGLIEELLAFGVKKIIACGSSGLIGDFHAEKFMIVTKAIRDEGLSYFYLEPSLYVDTDKELNKKIEEELTKRHLDYEEGITWTTDAFYRETRSRINKRKEQGAIAVEMECASMAAVCRYRNIPFSQILYFSDIVKQEGWSDFLDTRKSVKAIITKVILDFACEL
ncbi:MAG: nucleoside phosphorylase [Tenericutes bacterium]|nr:nucleoside phosphorylase [Mycoplasmatota bacterium]